MKVKTNKDVEFGFLVKEVQDVHIEREDVDEWHQVILDVLAMVGVDEIV